MDEYEEVGEEFPDIHALFMYYNDLYFGGVLLGNTTVEWSSGRMTSCGGTCSFSPLSGARIKLSEPLLKLRPVRDLKMVLLHEMIHAHNMTQRIRDPDPGGHGPPFKKLMDAINTSTVPDPQRPPGGYRITTTHSMIGEVMNYRIHWWECQRCGKTIKRAMNRPPQEADCIGRTGHRGDNCLDPNCGYHTHMRTCGGNYVKTREPEPKPKPARTRKQPSPSKKPPRHSGSLPAGQRRIDEPQFTGGAVAAAGPSTAPVARRGGKRPLSGEVAPLPESGGGSNWGPPGAGSGVSGRGSGSNNTAHPGGVSSGSLSSRPVWGGAYGDDDGGGTEWWRDWGGGGEATGAHVGAEQAGASPAGIQTNTWAIGAGLDVTGSAQATRVGARQGPETTQQQQQGGSGAAGGNESSSLSSEELRRRCAEAALARLGGGGGGGGSGGERKAPSEQAVWKAAQQVGRQQGEDKQHGHGMLRDQQQRPGRQRPGDTGDVRLEGVEELQATNNTAVGVGGCGASQWTAPGVKLGALGGLGPVGREVGVGASRAVVMAGRGGGRGGDGGGGREGGRLLPPTGVPGDVCTLVDSDEEEVGGEGHGHGRDEGALGRVGDAGWDGSREGRGSALGMKDIQPHALGSKSVGVAIEGRSAVPPSIEVVDLVDTDSDLN